LLLSGDGLAGGKTVGAIVVDALVSTAVGAMYVSGTVVGVEVRARITMVGIGAADMVVDSGVQDAIKIVARISRMIRL
jgi:hypothetical protein